MLDLLQDQKRNTEEVIEEMPVNTCQIVLIIELVVIPIKIGKIDFKTLLREITNRVRPQIHHCSQQVVLQDILAILIWQLRLTQNMKGRHLIITQELLQPQRPKKKVLNYQRLSFSFNPNWRVLGTFYNRIRNLLIAHLLIKPFDYGLDDLQ